MATTGLETNRTVKTIGNNAFRGTNFSCIYLLQNTLPTIGANAFAFNANAGILYVPEIWSVGDVVSAGGASYATSNDTLIYMYAPKITNVVASRLGTNSADMMFDSDIPATFETDIEGTLGQHTITACSNALVFSSTPDTNFDINYNAATYYGPTQKPYNRAVSTGLIVIKAWDYLLTVNAQTGGSVSISGGSYLAGDTVDVVATADDGYRFKGWLTDGLTVANIPNLQFEMPSSDVTLTAQFEKISGGGTGGSGGSTGGIGSSGGNTGGVAGIGSVNGSTSGTAIATPSTGDQSNIGFWIILGMTAATGLVLVFVFKRKEG